MMKHYGGQYHVELTVRKRQGLGSTVSEDNLDAGFCRLPFRPSDHLRRRVDAVHRASRPDMSFGRDRKGPCATADIQHGFSWFKAGQAENFLTKSPLPAECYQPDHEIIASGRVQDEADRPVRWIAIDHLHEINLLRWGNRLKVDIC